MAHTGLIVGSRLAWNENFDGMAHRLFETASVLGTLVGEDGLPGVDLVQRDGVLLNDFNGHRLGGREVPDLLALGLGLFEGPRNGSGVDVFVGLAQVEALGNDLARALAGGLLAHEESLGGGH